jgi:signal transduction histidine kinase
MGNDANGIVACVKLKFFHLEGGGLNHQRGYQMQARIRRFVEDRTLMLAAISHDLRTALTRLKLRTEFIPDGEQRTKALADLDEIDGMLNVTLSFAMVPNSR